MSNSEYNYRFSGIRLRYDNDSSEALRTAVLKQLNVEDAALQQMRVVRRSIDARKKPAHIIYTVDLRLTGPVSHDALRQASLPAPLEVRPGAECLAHSPIVVGGGPAGLFAAYFLAKNGYRPILVERGCHIKARHADMDRFLKTGVHNPESNTLFGMGGAGTYSDGKLTTSRNHPIMAVILQLLVEAGAPERILTDAKPHIGTDVLSNVVDTLARQIETLGGRILVQTKLDDLRIVNGRIEGVRLGQEMVDAQQVLLATGHSARDTWDMLRARGVVIAPKPFQMGVRVEHPQEWLDTQQYGSGAGHPSLGAADYKLTTRINEVPVFSFCMCPGGFTIPTVSEPGHLCVNGMSMSKRDNAFSCSGIVATLMPSVYGGSDVDAALAFVRGVETRCFEMGGGKYGAPAQRLQDWLRDETSISLPASSYALGLESVNLNRILPDIVSTPLKKAFPSFNRQLPGFIQDNALAIAPESRASSPLRIVRDKITRESVSVAGLYPVGEGSGYAGGIMSAALDGVRSALRIIEKFAPLG